MTKLLTIEEGVSALKNQEIILYPTEGVYGIGADARNEELARAICEIKGRPFTKGLIVLTDSLERLQDWIMPLSNEQQEMMKTLDFGFHHTWLLPRTDLCPDILSGDSPDLAVRLTIHPVARALCEGLQSPLISTSANVQGEPAILQLEDALQFSSSKVKGVVAGDLGGIPQATKIQHIVTGKIYRL